MNSGCVEREVFKFLSYSECCRIFFNTERLKQMGEELVLIGTFMKQENGLPWFPGPQRDLSSPWTAERPSFSELLRGEQDRE